MKIIADMSKNKYLAEVDSSELRELNSEVKIEVGAEFEIRKAAETLSALRVLDNRRLKHIGKAIKDLQTTFGNLEDSYHGLMLPEYLKKEQ